ncbi:hypothetical protein Patl1_00412 [Pistacia atlantica]|uniref:Uncharacterized protein n=1 Tax=Pistacia atlantica TaxID=434234 RepID=A0ACC1C816_9ROSI|nr:hypothetical protein Patl1_00412 [Pistacia atlantica]
MGRTPCCDKKGLKKGPWTPEEDEILIEYIKKNGHGSWRSLPKLAGMYAWFSSFVSKKIDFNVASGFRSHLRTFN